MKNRLEMSAPCYLIQHFLLEVSWDHLLLESWLMPLIHSKKLQQSTDSLLLQLP